MLLQIFLITLVFSIVFSALLVVLAYKKQWFLCRHDTFGVQKIHHHPTPHVGGVAVFLSFSIGCFLLPDLPEFLLPLLLISVLIFSIGLIEDLSDKVSPFWRLTFIFIALSISFFYLEIGVHSLGFAWMDSLLSYAIISLLFTLLVVGSAVNALNIVDGYNGLMSGYSMLVLLAMAVVAYQLNDIVIMQLNLLLVASLLGFFLLNFPKGKLFIGDGGAYFIGFMLSTIGLVFVSRHDEVLSNWFVLLLLIYPMYELLFSIYRKKIIHRTLATEPDNYHLHMLIYNQIVKRNPQSDKTMNNSKTAPFLWMLSLVSIIPAMFWYNDRLVLIGFVCLFMLFYTIIYNRIIKK